MDHGGIGNDAEVAALAMHTGLADRNNMLVFRHLFLDAAIQKFVFEKQDRVIVANGRLDQAFGIAGGSGSDYFHSWRMDEVHLGILRVKRAAMHSARNERDRKSTRLN